MRIGILVGTKGRGSNMAAIIRACQSGAVKGEVATVVAPSAEAPALEVARSLGVPVDVVPFNEDFAANLLKALKGCDVVCLAGFMRLVPTEVLAAFPDRVLNIHPALLPKFGGKGMYGHHVHEAVLAAGEKESGCTVHAVNERYDEGPVILQLKCPVLPDDTSETLAARVLDLEHQAYPQALAALADPSEAEPPKAEPPKEEPKAEKKEKAKIDLQHPFFTAVGLRIAIGLGWFLLTIFGPFRTRHRKKVPREGGLIILSNHLADVDPIAVQISCPRPIYFMAKSELFKMPVLGWALRMFRAFPVKRGEPDRSALRQAAETAKAGHAVCVFPEGQLSSDGKLKELKPGSALVVKLAGVPVICCGLRRTNAIMPYGKILPRPAWGWVSASWGQVRTFDRKDSVEDIVAWAEIEIRRLINEPGEEQTKG